MHDNSNPDEFGSNTNPDPYGPAKEAPQAKPKSIPEGEGMPKRTKILAITTAIVMLGAGAYFYHVKIASRPRLEPVPEGATHFRTVNNRAFTYEYEGQWYLFYAPKGKRNEPGMIRKLDEKDPFHPNNRKSKKPPGIKNANEI